MYQKMNSHLLEEISLSINESIPFENLYAMAIKFINDKSYAESKWSYHLSVIEDYLFKSIHKFTMRQLLSLSCAFGLCNIIRFIIRTQQFNPTAEHIDHLIGNMNKWVFDEVEYYSRDRQYTSLLSLIEHFVNNKMIFVRSQIDSIVNIHSTRQRKLKNKIASLENNNEDDFWIDKYEMVYEMSDQYHDYIMDMMSCFIW